MQQHEFTPAREYAKGQGEAVADRTVNRKVFKPVPAYTVMQTLPRRDDISLDRQIDEWCKSNGYKIKGYHVHAGDDHEVRVELGVTHVQERETWADVADRVSEGNALLLAGTAGLQEMEGEREAMRHHLRQASILMSGRHLQHGDFSQPGRNLEIYSNCSTSATSFLLFYLLLNGSGVGRDYSDHMIKADLSYMPIVVPVIDMGHKDVQSGEIVAMTRRDAEHLYAGRKIVHFEVPDSREGWAKVLEKIEYMAFLGTERETVFVPDFSKVRSRNSPIAGMQGRPASGPGPLMQAIANIARLRDAGMAPWRAAMYADHYAAECVLVGGARRAARMATKYWKDETVIDFVNLKRGGFLWSSNNSVLVDAEFWELVQADEAPEGKLFSWQHARAVFKALTEASYFDQTGEPGLINVDRLTWNAEGIEELMDGNFAESDKYKLEAETLELTKSLVQAWAAGNYQVITNPCVTGDTWVQTSEGPRQVNELIDTPFKAMVDGKEYQATGFWKTGDKKVFKVKTDRGYEVRATDNHKLLVEVSRKRKFGAGAGHNIEVEWVEVKDLEPGDKLVISDHSRPVASFDHDEFNRGWLIGEVVGDGGYNPARYPTYVRFWGEERGRMAAFAATLIDSGVQVHKGNETAQVACNALTVLADGLIAPEKKTLLPALEKKSESFVAGFLRGLFDADGSVQGSIEKGISVRLWQADEQRIKAVQRMLLRFGIASTIYFNRELPGERDLPDGDGGVKSYLCNAGHELTISKDNVVRFAERVGFYDESKKSRLVEAIGDRKRPVYKERFTAEVVSVEEDGVEPVYDCTVDEVHRFCANGIVAHNCGEIVLASIGSYCVSGNTRILFKNGQGAIRDLVGVPVEVWNGEEWSVVTPFKTGENQQLLRVTLSDGSYLDCTPYHRFSVKWSRQGVHYKEVQAKDLKVGHILPTFRVGEIDGNHVPDAYTYGVFLGDGWIGRREHCNRQNRYGVTLYKGKHDLPVVGKRSELKTNGGIEVNVANALRRDWMDQLKGENLPEFLFYMDKESTLNFVRGWLDTDGCYHKDTGGVSITTCEEGRARDLQLLLRRAGFSYVTLKKVAKAGDMTNFGPRNKSLWMVYIPAPEARLVQGYRVKSEYPLDLDRVVKQPRVVSVEPLPGLHETYCFTEPKRGMGVFGNMLTYQCVIADVVPFHAAYLTRMNADQFSEQAVLHLWDQDAENAFRVATRALIRTNLMDSLYKKEVRRTNRIGVGMTGFHEYAWARFGYGWKDLINEEKSKDFWLTVARFKRAVQDEARTYSEKLGVVVPHTNTTFKPAGCASLDTAIKTTEGVLTMRELFAKHGVTESDLRGMEDGTWIEPTVKTLVLDEGNVEREVTKLYLNGVKPVYEIEFEDGVIVKLTGNHKLKTVTGEWRRVDELTEKDDIAQF